MTAVGFNWSLTAGLATAERAAARSSSPVRIAVPVPSAWTAPDRRTRRRATLAFRSIDLSMVGYPVNVDGLLNAIQVTFVFFATFAFR
jgi:hypothetical protein